MIQFQNVTKRYEETGATVLEHFNEEISDGEFILLTGESGAGKSTFIHLLIREIMPTKGRIYVDGQDIMKLGRRQIPCYRRKIGVVFQEFRLVRDMTIYENMKAAQAAMGGRAMGARIASLFSLMGLTGLYRRYPAELSGGQQQKVCLARALLNDPHLLLADEPTGNLDPASSGEMMRLFDFIHQQGVTVVVATHDREAAKGLPYREIRLKK